MDRYVRVKTGLSGAVPVESRAFYHLQVARAGSTLKSDAGGFNRPVPVFAKCSRPKTDLE